MADEVETVVETEPLVAPEEGAEEQQTTEPGPIEELASKLGWKPKDQFEGNDEAWKPADEFILASRDIQRNLSQELRSVRDEVSRMGRTSAQLLEQTLADKIAERDTYWKRVHAQAVKDDNPELAERAVDERIKLASETPKTPADDAVPPSTAAWIERQKEWFGSPGANGTFVGGDPLARSRAMAVCDTLAKQGVAPDEQLRQAERAVRKEFPELFPTPAKTPAGVQTGASRSTGPSSRAKGYADMPAESQKMAQDYLKRHGIPLEKFAESYFADPANHERKAG